MGITVALCMMLLRSARHFRHHGEAWRLHALTSSLSLTDKRNYQNQVTKNPNSSSWEKKTKPSELLNPAYAASLSSVKGKTWVCPSHKTPKPTITSQKNNQAVLKTWSYSAVKCFMVTITHLDQFDVPSLSATFYSSWPEKSANVLSALTNNRSLLEMESHQNPRLGLCFFLTALL